MKRILSKMIKCLVVLSTLVSLVGCSPDSKGVIMGHWLALVADSFGMQNYVSKEPYFKNITSENPYFSAVQAAVEWDIVDKEKELNVDSMLTWNEALISLVNAGEFLDEKASDDDKIDYAIGNFDDSIRKYWGKRDITLDEAVELLDKAQSLWTNKTYDKSIEKSSFSDVVNNLMSKKDLKYEQKGEIVKISTNEVDGLKVGDVYTLPANSTSDASINRIQKIEIYDEYAIITNDETFTEEEAGKYIEEIKVQDTIKPDFSNQVSGIYDEYGNPISFKSTSRIQQDENYEETAMMDQEVSLSTLENQNFGNQKLIKTDGIFSSFEELTFKIKEKYTVKLKFHKNDLGLEVSKEMKKSSNRYKEEKTQIFGKFSLKDFTVTRDIDFSWGKLHSATIKLGYKTVLEAGIKKTRTGEIGRPDTGNEEQRQRLGTVIDEYKNALLDLKTSVKNSKIEDDIYICRLHIWGNSVASVDFILKGKVEANGEFKVIVETAGTQGIQYKKGNARFIKSKATDTDFVADASLAMTIGPGVALTLAKKINFGEIDVDLGAGVSIESRAHLYDEEGHQLFESDAFITNDDAEYLMKMDFKTNADDILEYAKSNGKTWSNYQNAKSKGNIAIQKGICLEWKLYPIVKVSLNKKSLLGEYLSKVGFIFSWEVVGSKNIALKGHIDAPNSIGDALKSESFGKGLATILGIGADCTYKVKPWDDEDIKYDKNVDDSLVDSDMSITENIVLSDIRIFLDYNQKQNIQVIGLPKDYSLKDLIVDVEDKDIATFNVTSGVVTAKEKPGTTYVVVSTSDNKFKAYCAITVKEAKKPDFVGI